MQVLYRKYRPMNFAEVIGQEHIKQIITNEIKMGKVAHSFLFFGPRGVGKTTLARIISKSLNCEKRKDNEFEPCNKCDSCKSINTGSDLNIIEIDAASHTGVDNVRENIISVSRVAVNPNKYKVFIIDEVHMLSTSAFNALLKTLEEPPRNVIFILATTEVHKVPQTIISRCQRFDFQKIALEKIVKCLAEISAKEGVKIKEEILKNIAYNSEGCLRDAESMLGQILSIGEKEVTEEQAEIIIPKVNVGLIFSLTEFLIKKDAKSGIISINKNLNQGVNLIKLTQDLIEFFRKLILIKINASLEIFTRQFTEDDKSKVLNFSNKLIEKEIFAIIEILNKRLSEMPNTKIVQLPLELAVIEICSQNFIQHSNFCESKAEGKIEEKKVEKFIKKDNLKITADSNKADIKSCPNKNGSVNIKLTNIKDGWTDIINEAKKFNNSIASTLKMSELKELNENILTLCFKYEFHQKKIADIKNKTVVEDIIKQKFKEIIIINSVYDENFEYSDSDLVENNQATNRINEVFSSEII
ncbi:MAG: DNA polymerase III subunit gamma/tau [Patescibacteria group bacterium]|nr:DNA polymerase III subunit gamma/tau [Patescibacteria group bacterium]